MDEQSRPDCRSCTDPVKQAEHDAQLERLWKRMVLREGEAVSEDVYEYRLSVCLACDALLGGSTCRYCGCLVKWRSRLTASSCPHPGSPRW